MTRFHERLAKLEAAEAIKVSPRRVVQHVLDCAPSERPERVAAIGAADPKAFHIVRIVVRPGEAMAA